MADDGSAQGGLWPVPSFHFKVTIGSIGEIAFQEVSGLDTEHEVIEYRAGTYKPYSTVKMPGLNKPSDVTLKKGMFKDDKALYTYFQSINMNIIKRETVTIELIDESDATLFKWELTNAFPMKMTGPSLNAQNSEVALEEITLAHEGLKLAA